jgi:NTP pyrophosphatase (non-canonical NTP hydrolase)
VDIDKQIHKALEHAETKHPKFCLNIFQAVSILTEEVGEVAKAINDNQFENAIHELYQVIAVSIRFIKHMEKD